VAALAEKPVATDARSASRQAAWNYLIFAMSKSSTLVMTMVLARLLAPSDFGLFALALVILNLFDYLRDLGVAAALVQRGDRWSRLAPTGLTLSVVFGALLAAACALLAPSIAGLLGNRALSELVRVLAVGLLVGSTATLPLALLRRRLDFRGRMIPELAGAVAKMVVSIGFAYSGAGVWSLVWGQLTAAAVTTTLYWAVSRPEPRFGFDYQVARSLLGFGLPVTSIGLLSFVVYSLPTAVIGRLRGSEELGLYSLAYRLPELLVLALCVVVGEVLFSALSRVQDDRPALARRYLSAVAVVMALVAPIGLGMAAVAPDLIVVLYGERYRSAADVLAVLAVYSVLYAASFHSGDVYKAIGRPIILTWITLGGLAVLLPTVWIAAGYSAVAVAGALLCLEFVHFNVRIIVVGHILHLPVRRQLANYRGPVLAAVLMAVVVLGAGLLLPSWPPAARLFVLVALGGAVYVALLRWLADDALCALRSVVRRAA
jgi:PST family polysaccharide transporter